MFSSLFNDLYERARSNDAETDILTADELDHILLGEAQIVHLDRDLFAVREVGQRTDAKVADDRVGVAGGSSGERCHAVVEHDRAALERIYRVGCGVLCGLERSQCLLVHNDDRVRCFVAQVRDGGSDRAERDARSSHDRNAGGSLGVRSRRGDDRGNELVSRFLRDPVGQLVIDVADELFTAEVDCFV